MKKISILLSLLITTLATSCGNGLNPNPNPPEPPEPESPYHIVDPSFACPIRGSQSEVTYTDLFNLGNKVSISIDITLEELQKIYNDNDYDNKNKPETYRRACSVTISMLNGNNTYTWTFENVGIRQKGNTSRKRLFEDENTLCNQNHFKLSFDETFTETDRYESSYIEQYGNIEYEDREFLGLSGLDFKCDKNDDTTHLKEIYSSYMLRSAGILVQHIGLSTVKINYGDKVADFGLCYLFEPASKSLIKRALQSDDKYINMEKWSKEKSGTYEVSGKKYGDMYKASYGKGNGASSGADFTSNSILYFLVLQ